MVTESILTPYVKPEQVVLDKESIDLFEQLETRAHAHAIARGEHDALLYMHIYAIWNASLWRARYDSWEDYCDEWDKLPMGVSKSSIKHKMTDIKKMLSAGVTPEVVIKSLGNIPMATRGLLDELVQSKDGQMYVNRKFYEQLPEGFTVSNYLDELADLGPIQANLAVDELINRDQMYITDTEYDDKSKRVFFKIVMKSKVAIIESELFIPNVPEWASRFIQKRLGGVKR